MILPKPYYEKDGIVIYNAHCRNILRELPCADLAITDPPYGKETHAGARTGDGDKILVDFSSITADELRGIMELANIKRWWISFMEWRHIAELERKPPINLEFIRMGIWVKPNGAPQFTGDRPGTGWEGVGLFHKPGKKFWNGGGHHAVWIDNKENTLHPTGKPISLINRLMDLFSLPDELVLDPFMGSGTTLLSAKELGRKAIGIEIEEKYCEIAAKRLSQDVFDFTEINPQGEGGE